jgi:hypothetical protein
MDNYNGYVSWKWFLAGLGTLSAILLSSLALAWQVHQSQPHSDAVSSKELDRVVEQLSKRIERLEKEQ